MQGFGVDPLVITQGKEQLFQREHGWLTAFVNVLKPKKHKLSLHKVPDQILKHTLKSSLAKSNQDIVAK